MMTQEKKSECRKMVDEYVEQYNLYGKKQKLGYDIAGMSRYAMKQNRPVSELTQEEAAMFTVE